MKDYDLKEIFTQIELELIKSMKRAFAFHKREEEKEGFKWEQWQSTKLRNLEKFRRDNQKIIDKFGDPIEEAIKNTLNENFNAGQNRVLKIINRIRNILKKSNKKEASFNFPENIEPKTPIQKLFRRIFKTGPKETGFFGVNEKKLKSLIDATTNDLKNGRTAMLRMSDDVYRQTIFKSHMFLQSGAKTIYQAVDMATKDFLDKGINCIVYKDGKRVNIASYAEMALRTASQRATFMGEGQKRDEWDIHLVVVSAHANTCKLCLPWQGKVLIDDVYSHPSQEYTQEYSKKYKLLSEAMKAGLLHPNCRHTLSTYFEGITQLPKVPDEDTINTNYAAEQKQRYLERQIRKWKRVEAGSVDAENVSKAEDKVKQYENMLQQHLSDNPQLRRNNWRESNPGISDKDIEAHKQELKDNAENAKIKEIKDFIKSGKQPLNIELGKQGKHIIGNNNYIEGRSYLTISMEEAQELINKYAGTGRPNLNLKGEWNNKELIMANKNIGVSINNKTGEKTVTNKFIIHYSKNGTHIVPTVKKE
ncbi:MULTISPECIES: phage minor capsid protein [Clostridium]|uniref:phage minor capsid protein n=1 Tax=Clostridium TaxID=1485 RepID=UPI0006C6C499|nr:MULTISPECIES: phage minor capsid protein [Clostridium]KOF56626.1 hypothetical protein AGR56_07790 [Clostridium sp. DMHC 10]MCD2348462.1 polymorphic toxin type 50 domain-containing protein [Clostridium guangxiense]